MKKINFISELALITGILLNGFAVMIYVKSNLGVSTISSIPFIVNQIMPVISLGIATILFEVLLIAILVLVIGRHKSYLFSLVLGLFFGVIIDVYKYLFTFIAIDQVNNIVLYITAFICLSLGISLTLLSNLTALPFDIFVQSFANKTGKTIKFTKTAFDIVCVFITVSISLLFFGKIKGVGIGTIISMLFTGNAVQIFTNSLGRYFNFISIKQLIDRKT